MASRFSTHFLSQKLTDAMSSNYDIRNLRYEVLMKILKS